MSLRLEVLLLIILCMLVTQVSRLTPLIFSQKIHLSKNVKTWLKFVPTAVISALLFQELLLAKGVFLPPEKYHYAVAGATTLLIGLFTRNLIFTIFLGIFFFSLWEIVFS